MIRSIRAVLAAAVLLLMGGLTPALAQTSYQYTDGHNGIINLCAWGVSNALAPCRVEYGIYNGAPKALSVDANGNLNANLVSGSVTASFSGFTPTAGAVANLPVTTTSADVALPGGTTVIVTNTGASDAAFRIQLGAGTAATTDMTLKAGAAVGLSVGTATHLSAITASGATTLNIQGGTGGVAGYGGGSAGGGGGGAVTIADGASVTLGAKADAAASSDTATASEISLIKRLLQGLTTLNGAAAGPLPAQTSHGVNTGGIEGVAAAGASDTDNPLNNGGRVATALPTAAADGQKAAAMLSKDGKTINDPFAPDDLRVRGFATSTVNTAVPLIAAPGAGVGLNIVTVACWNNNASTDAQVTFNDSVSTQITVPHGVGPVGFSTQIPLSVATNTAFTFTVGTATSTVGCFVGGYKVH